ncbi:MAG: hypothetical protein R3237_03765 [Nitrosopumilaceae archaeon]|nr:hypothetical protein [Nitrosopumilaceae archaeon]
MKEIQIKNVGGFFSGIIILIVGMLIVLFDYPQIQYFEGLDSETFSRLDLETKNIFERLKIEFSIGVILLGGGITMSAIFLVKKQQNKNQLR